MKFKIGDKVKVIGYSVNPILKEVLNKTFIIVEICHNRIGDKWYKIYSSSCTNWYYAEDEELEKVELSENI